ncbi:MAG: glutamine amidotransferase-related protein [Thermoproteota archaeon]
MVKEGEIFEGLPNPFTVREAHYCEVKKLPEDFLLLASMKDCHIQAMKHRSRTIYSTQFHPEGGIRSSTNMVKFF